MNEYFSSCKNESEIVLTRKSTIQKFDPPYQKKPAQKTYSTTSVNHNPEVAALDNVNKILTFGPMPSYNCGETQRVLFQSQNNVGNVDGSRLKDHKPPLKRLGVDDEDGGTGLEEVVSFIDLPPNSLAKLPEKGILKKHGGYAGIAEGPMVEMQRKLNSLNGYHGDLIEVFRNAANHRGMASTPSSSSNLVDDEVLRKSLADCGYADAYRKVQQAQAQQQQDGQDNIDNQEDEDEDDVPPSCGPMRIRTLEDIIRQLEHHSTRHMSPSGSEDMRISEGEGDRHYRIDSSVGSESSQGDAFIQAQHQIARWTSEEGGGGGGGGPGGISINSSGGGNVQHRPPQQPPPLPLQLPASPAAVLATMGQQIIQQLHQQRQQSRRKKKKQQQQLPAEQLPISERGYYPSPPHTDNGLDDATETDPQRDYYRDDDDEYGTRDDKNNDDDDEADSDDKFSGAVNAQSHHDIKLLNNNDKKINEIKLMRMMRNPDDTIMTMMREIDVKKMPNINKRPLDDKYSLECNIMIDNGGDELPSAEGPGRDEDDDEMSKNNTSNNTSDNENTALLPPSHFPEYKH